MQSQRLVTKNQSNSSSEPSAGWCLCRGGCAAECFVLCWERLPTHRQANSKGKAQGNQCCASKGGRRSSGERKLLADFQYHHVIQVSCFTCGFWAIVEGLFKIAALLFSSPPFFHPMLSRLSTQRNHYARVAQGRVTQPTHLFQVRGRTEVWPQRSTRLFILVLTAGTFVRECCVCVHPVVCTPSRCF